MSLHPSTCPLDCADACGVLIESDDKGRFVGLRGNPEHGYSKGTLCAKTSWYGEVVNGKDRLLLPHVRQDDGSFEPSTWDAALDLVAERLGAVKSERILALEYAGSMGVLARHYPKRVMRALGATFHNGGICDNASTAGYEVVFGNQVGFDLELADTVDGVLIWGADIARTLQHLQPAVQRLAKAGVPVVAIDVYRSDTLRAVERWGGCGIVVRPGSDGALALGLARMAFEAGRVDREQRGADCLGLRAFEEHVCAAHDQAWVLKETGISPEELERLRRLLFDSANPLIKLGIGWSRRRNGAGNVRAACSLLAVLGWEDNVHYESGSVFGVNTDLMQRPDLGIHPNGKAPEIMSPKVGAALEQGRYGAVVVWSHNPAMVMPDSARVRRGLAREDVFVVVHEQVWTETARLADVVLPATTFVEQTDLYRSYGHRRLQLGRVACKPPVAPGQPHDGPRSNVRTFSDLGRRMGLAREVWDVTEEGLCEVLLEDLAPRLGEEALVALRSGVAWKMPPPQGRGTPSGKIELTSQAASDLGQAALPTYVPDDGGQEAGEFVLHPIPSRATHNSTYNSSPRHLRRAGAPAWHLHPKDASALGLSEGQKAIVESAHGQLTLPVHLNPDCARGLVLVEGLPPSSVSPEGQSVNSLVGPELTDMGANSVQFGTRISIQAAPVLLSNSAEA